MKRPTSKSLNFRNPLVLSPSKSESSCARSRTLSRLKSDGHNLIARLSGPLRRSKSQCGSLTFSATSFGEIRYNTELKAQTEQIMESDTRHEFLRYHRRREHTQSSNMMADARSKRRKDSENSDYADENNEPLLACSVYGEKTKWISGIRSYLSLRRRDSHRREKLHKKSKSVPTTTPVSIINHAAIADVTVPFGNNRSGILVVGQSIKSPISPLERKHFAVPTPAKVEQRERRRCQSSATTCMDHQRNSSCISTSNFTVNSENLTAREFADMTGIRICSDDEDLDDELVVERASTPQKTCQSDEELISQSSLFSTPHTTIYSNHITANSFGGHSRTSSTLKKPQIWEQEFWKNSEDLQAMPLCFSSLQQQEGYQIENGMLQLPKSKSAQLEPYHHGLRNNHRRIDSSPMPSTPSIYEKSMTIDERAASERMKDEKSRKPIEPISKTKKEKPIVVRKGRFEIIYGSPPEDSLLLSKIYPPEASSASFTDYMPDEESNLLSGRTVEWKRKKHSIKE
ncbi:hypothetical protein K450DRAFT_291619 [Umbelopsis ramanniana AG]|uniref:Uncharacterized protein n=1 Tax=Umbelopsis ramanniana AG TaxID=1314678 RepID=A0AAD5E2E5_UMBRA|nr:uncharacterized protein K450DRAFT_291619 [Umbelopsis ramanniana AG]KAI8576328.1 hypothetical protein K450DRAFT_291619 [Umbelopsis ramanniana AG]